MYDDPGIVEFRTNIEGWVGKDGLFYGKDEHRARWANSTHFKCDCGSVAPKGYTICNECRDKKDEERYRVLPYVEYNGEPVFSRSGDFFYDEDALMDYMYENDLEEVDLYPTYESYYDEVDSDYWSDIIPKDADDVHPKLREAINTLNAIIKTLPPASYFEDNKKRTSYKLSK